jgi:outer membrane protein assembly factor BamB
VANGRVYVGDRDGWIYCLDAVTGTLYWRYRAGHDIKRRIEFSSPAVAEGRVYIGCWDNQLYCLDALNGILHWTFKTGGIIQSSPAVVGGKVYVGSTDSKVYCLDAMTGTHIWNYKMGDITWSSPAVAHGRIYVGSRDDNVYCLNATTGALIWRYETDGAVYSSPAVAGDRVYVGSYDKRIYCLDAATGKMLWTYKTGDYVFSSPAIADGRVYIGSHDNKLYAFGSHTNIFPAVINGTTHYITVISNSEISNFTFDHSSKNLTFAATGPHGTPAFANITLPRTVLREPLTMMVDGSPGTPIKTTNTTHVSLFIDYLGDLRLIEIAGAAAAPSLLVDPLMISFPRSYPIDYPALMNHTTLTNDGNGTITVEAIKLTLNEGNAYKIEAI